MCPYCYRPIDGHNEWQRKACMRALIDPPRPGSWESIRAAVDASSGPLRQLTIETGAPGTVAITLHLRWWSYLLLGVYHWFIRRRVRRALEEVRPVGASYDVRVR